MSEVKFRDAMLNLMVALQKSKEDCWYSHTSEQGNQAEFKSTSVTYSLNWMLAGTVSDVEDNFMERKRKEAGRQRKIIQKS